MMVPEQREAAEGGFVGWRSVNAAVVVCAALLLGCGQRVAGSTDATADTAAVSAAEVVDAAGVAQDVSPLSDASILKDAICLPGDASGACPPANDATAADSATTGSSDAYICPSPSEPGPDTYVGDVPQPPTWSCAVEPPDFFKGKPPPATTLAIEIGAVAQDGSFKPHVEGGWIPMVHGPQGGFHIFAGMRVKVPGATLPKLKLQVEARLWDGCKIVGYGVAPVVYGNVQDGSGTQTYVVGEAAVPGPLVIFDDGGTGVKSSQAWYYCNRWYDLRVAMRDVLTGAWGHAMVRVRTYDKANHK